MRVDQFAYQRATQVASFGLALQILLAGAMLLFGLLAHDTAVLFASVYALLGAVCLWPGLLVIFNQHKLERLEALEETQLAASRGEGGSVFDRADEETHVAARRLRLMHSWLMPILSGLLAVGLVLAGWLMLADMARVGEQENPFQFRHTEHIGWAVALCLSSAAISFIFSRFVAGMAKQTAWQNLRGGASYMVGNALVTLAVGVGFIFRFFNNDALIQTIGHAIPFFMIALAGEIVLNLILNFYRPRVQGEAPRPAFDSKVLSLFAAPDNLVRSLNEAVNYQFGFDVTSTWGYQLLLRSVTGLIVVAVLMLVALNCMVIVEPHQQAIRLRGGAIVGDVHGSGVMFKWPWPFETAAVHDVSRIRELSLTARRTRRNIVNDIEVNLWSDSLEGRTDVPFEPLLVRSVESLTPEQSAKLEQLEELEQLESPGEQGGAADVPDIFQQLALVELEIVMEYRIRSGGESPGSGLLDYLTFASDERTRRHRLTERERMMQAIAQREIRGHLVRLTIDDVLNVQDGRLASMLQTNTQRALDAHAAGVEVVAVNLLMVRPAGDQVRNAFADVPMMAQARQEDVAKARRDEIMSYAIVIGDANLANPVLQGVQAYSALTNRRATIAARIDGARARGEAQAADELARQLAEIDEQLPRRRLEVERLLMQGGGEAAQTIAQAERQRWVSVMQTRTRATRVRSEMKPYQAAPELFRERRKMELLLSRLPSMRKFVIGLDPSRVSVSADLKELNPLLNFQDAVAPEEEEPQGTP